MRRASKRIDYAIVLLVFICRDPRVGHSAQSLASATKLSKAVVKKILGMLVQDGILESQCGTKGGYRLARRPQEITLASVMTAFDRRLPAGECVHDSGKCPADAPCPIKAVWRDVSSAMEGTLGGLSFASLVDSARATLPQTAPVLHFAPLDTSSLAAVALEG